MPVRNGKKVKNSSLDNLLKAELATVGLKPSDLSELGRDLFKMRIEAEQDKTFQTINSYSELQKEIKQRRNGED